METKDITEYKKSIEWNQTGFREVDSIIDQFKDFADLYNKKGLFRMKVKETGDSQKLILVIKLEK